MNIHAITVAATLTISVTNCVCVCNFHFDMNHCVNLEIFINPRRMREGYGSWFVYLSVCLSVTMLAATYLVCASNLRCYKVPYGVPNA